MLTDLEARYIKARRAGKCLNPTPGHRVTTRYGIQGDAWGAGHHTGEDHACPVGTPVVAVSWGHVVGAGWSALGWGQAYGNIVIVEMANGEHIYGYCHLHDIRVRVGQAVIPGQVLGHVGYTGHVLPPGPAGAHLHFEVRPPGGRYGSDVNPDHAKCGQR